MYGCFKKGESGMEKLELIMKFIDLVSKISIIVWNGIQIMRYIDKKRRGANVCETSAPKDSDEMTPNRSSENKTTNITFHNCKKCNVYINDSSDNQK